MTVDIAVPTLPESVPDATLLPWKKAVGEVVSQEELLVELETDKVILEVTAPSNGILREILKQSGEQVSAGDTLARVEATGSVTAPLETQSDARDDAARTTQDPIESDGPVKPPSNLTDLAPAVRKMVMEHGLDPNRIPGTGRDGRLTKEDVLAYLARDNASSPTEAPPHAPERPRTSQMQPPPSSGNAPISPTLAASPADLPDAPRPERREPLSRIRARIAERLIEAQQTAAILTTFNEVNLQPVQELRKRYRAAFEKTHGLRLGLMSFFVKAAVRALIRFPVVNASLLPTEVVYHDYYDIGVAVSSPRGLVVPVLRDADRLSFAGIEAKINEFGQKAEAARLSVDELAGGTFTITNGGVFGSLMSTPILNPPQSAILGMHKIQDRPMSKNGQVVVWPMMYLALSYDHRLIDGQDAVRFLVEVKDTLEDPFRLLLDT